MPHVGHAPMIERPQQSAEDYLRFRAGAAAAERRSQMARRVERGGHLPGLAQPCALVHDSGGAPMSSSVARSRRPRPESSQAWSTASRVTTERPNQRITASRQALQPGD